MAAQTVFPNQLIQVCEEQKWGESASFKILVQRLKREVNIFSIKAANNFCKVSVHQTAPTKQHHHKHEGRIEQLFVKN